MYAKYLERNMEDINNNNKKKILKKIQYYATFTKKAENYVQFYTTRKSIITLK